MKNRRLRLVVLHGVIVLLASFASLRASTPLQANEPQLDKPVQSATEPPRQSRSRLRTLADKLPVYFIENAGQTDSRVAYYVRGADKLIYFAPEGLTFVLNSYPQRDGGAARAPAESALLVDAQLEAAYHTSLAVKLNFVGADPNVRPLGEDRAPTLISYFHGDRDNWRTGLRTYTRLVYPDLWPGIDLVYSGTVQRLKYQFVVKPNADPQQIKLRYRGAESVSVTAAGKLEVKTSGTTFEDDRPIAYQEIDGQPLEVPVSYCLDDDETDGRSYGFRLGVYDSNKPLIIDPAILVYAGFVGGSGNDRGNAIAVDADGNAYITGETNSTQLTFPDKAGPDRLYNGGVDAFVAKVNAAGTALVYAGYIGGSGDERGNGIAVDSAGAVYVTGETSSMQTSFPVTGGPDIFHNGGVDAFVAKISANGTSLIYAGYVGGSGDDRGKAIALEPGCASNCSAFITGETNSIEASFPETAGFLDTFGGGVDSFVAKVNSAGTGLIYAGYIGGTGDDRGNGIAVDSAGAAYITGETSSVQTSFPVTGGPDVTHNGGIDAFVAKISANGTSLIYAGYVGGSGDDRANAIALEPGCASNCRAYITGETNSTEASFPETAGSLDTFGGGVDAFVAQVDDSGAALVYAGYIGGSGDDRGNAVAADGAGNAYVTGETNSGQASFPETVGPDLTYNGGVDAFVAEVNAGGTTVVFAGYIGGLADDRAKGVAVDAAGGIYIVGETSSTAASFPDKVGPDRNQNGGFDAFVVKICADTCVDLTVAQTDLPDPVRVGDDITYTVTVTNDGPDDATNVVLEDEVPAGITIVSATPSVGTCSITTTISCDLGDLTNGSNATVTIVATTTAKGTLLNKVSVTADQTDTDGSNSANTERTVATLGNLVLRAFTTAKAAIPGTDIVIDDTTFNGGAVGSQDSTTRFYLSADRKLDGADVLLGSRAIPALGAKTGNSGSTTVTIPLGTVLGRFFLLGLADADNSVGETREANKETRTLKVTRPDLEVSALRAPQKTSAGALITVEDTTINKEPVASGGSTTKFYLSTDKVFGGDALLGSRAIPALGPEAKSAGSTTVTIPLATAPGKYFLIGVADADGAIAETNETDNTRARAITVGP